ncbi:MAG: hypothetical protein SVV67_04275, partial [Bacillota bacterium]|nr:hypothetical protein [Bacillota bacterium]
VMMTEIQSFSTRSMTPEDLNENDPGDEGSEGDNTGEEDTGEEEPGTGDSGEEGSNDEGAGEELPGEDGTGGEEGTGDENLDGNEGSGDEEESGSNGEDPGEDNTGSDDNQVLNTEVKMATVAPSCKELSWNFTSTGSKRSYVRVKPSATAAVDCHIYIAVHLEVGTETAWVGKPNGTPFTRGDWSQYFVYPLGVYTESNKLKLDILYGSNYTDTGDAYFWDDGERLYFQFETIGEEMGEVHIYAGVDPPTNDAPGKLGWKFNVNNNIFEYDTVVIFPYQGASADVYLSILYGGAVPVSISLCSQSEDYWFPGGDGWYYYGTAAGGPTLVYPGDNVGVCFTYCAADGDVDNISVSLEAEAVQWSNGAINSVWGTNPWNH